MNLYVKLFVISFYICLVAEGKLSENKTNGGNNVENNYYKNTGSGGISSMLFADELKQTLEKYLFGICPQNFKMSIGAKKLNSTLPTCDLDTEQEDLAGRLATLSLRAHTASRTECSRLGAALANTLGELARTAANRQNMSNAANDSNKKRKLSKSQKAKIQAKQRTALAVKKKAAALAAAAAAKAPA